MMEVHLLVKPGKRVNRIIEEDSGLVVELKAKPIDGAANAELRQVLADHFAVAKNQITIIRGANSRHKTIRIGRS